MAKVSCILRQRVGQLIFAYSWARLAILATGKGRGGNVFISSVSSLSSLFFFLPCPSLSSPLPSIPLLLTHLKLNKLFHTIRVLEESIFDFRYVKLYDVDIPEEKWLNYLQTVETKIRCHILWHLIWVCTVCHLSI